MVVNAQGSLGGCEFEKRCTRKQLKRRKQAEWERGAGAPLAQRIPRNGGQKTFVFTFIFFVVFQVFLEIFVA